MHSHSNNPCGPWHHGRASWMASGWKKKRRGRGGPWGPPPPPWFAHFFGEPPRRAERGEVRWLILDALSEQPRHGYEVIQTIKSRSGGGYSPSPGTVYPTLQMLEEMELVTSTEEKRGRKVYALTDKGKEELEAHRGEVEDAYERFGGGSPPWGPADPHELARWMKRLMRSFGRSLRRGHLTDEKRKAIETVIREAAERIEQIMRGDEPG